MSGTHTILVEFFTVTARASQATVAPGQTVTFDATVSGYTLESEDRIYWRFIPATESPPWGGAEITSCAGLVSCTYAPPATGTMYPMIGGRYGTAMGEGTTVSVVDLCLTGDSLLDHPAVRELMRTAWANSNADDADRSQRRERTGLVFRHPETGRLTTVPYFDDSRDGPCRSTAAPSGTFPGLPIAVFHTHPFSNLESTTGTCGSSGAASYLGERYGGPSRADFERLQSDHQSYSSIESMLILDKDKVVRFDVGTTRLNWRDRVKRYPRSDPRGCTRP
jgi:hypothetical protein